jgi:hypothetical protein
VASKVYARYSRPEREEGTCHPIKKKFMFQFPSVDHQYGPSKPDDHPLRQQQAEVVRPFSGVVARRAHFIDDRLDDLSNTIGLGNRLPGYHRRHRSKPGVYVGNRNRGVQDGGSRQGKRK